MGTDELQYADDLRVGTTYRLGSYTVSEDELLEFARQWDPQVFHLDKQAAADGYYGGLIASGVHTLAVYQRLAVRGAFQRMSVIAGRALREVRFLRPVRAGDTLTGVLRLDRIVPDEHDRALVTIFTELTNQRREPVLSVLVDAFLRMRPPPH